MDRLQDLGNQLSQITMYDIKSVYNQAKNVVLNVSEIEAKVREATNDDPWGASSTLMQDIANRTFNYPEFNEIMPAIYSRFMEKEARQWRQIYKALQLLEYLIKNGSERVVDDARSHVSTIKMLRNFHHIDDKGKDQGINIRNRSKEIVELLSDVDKIRSERRKAKANRNKYTGQGNDGMSFSNTGGGGGRYGGFGNDTSSYVGGSGGSNDYYGRSSYSGGGGRGGGGNSSSFSDDRRFEEYDAGDDEVISSAPKAKRSDMNTRKPERKASTSTSSPPAPPPAPKEVNLFDGFGDDDGFTAAPPVVPNKDVPASKSPNVIDDDGFGDFETAPVASTPAPAPITTSPPPATNPNANLFNMLKSQSMVATPPLSQPIMGGAGMFAQQPLQQQQPVMGMGMGGGMGHRPTNSGQFAGFASHPMHPQQAQQQPVFNALAGGIGGGGMPAMQPSYTGGGGPKPSTLPAVNSGGIGGAATGGGAKSSNFDDLWSMSLGSSKTTTTNPNAGKSIKDLEKEKAAAGLWGQQAKPPQMGMGGAGFGSFSTSTSTSGGAGGVDDLLL